MGLGIPPLKLKNMLESKPSNSRVSASTRHPSFVGCGGASLVFYGIACLIRLVGFAAILILAVVLVLRGALSERANLDSSHLTYTRSP